MAGPVLAIDDLHVRFATHDGVVEAARGVSLRVEAGKCLGVVGESGSGKSQSFLAALGLLSDNGSARGSARFKDQELLGLAPSRLNRIRGSKATMIFQDAMTALTPHMRVGAQIAETLQVHLGLSTQEARAQALAWLKRVHIADPERRMRQYPHELSGGMRQRVMIAQALACGPELLIADEPTTALDVTVQAEVLDLLAELMRETRAALVLISHDMGVVARLADRIAVMKDGRVVEEGPVRQVFSAPADAYTRRLIAAVPRLDRANTAALQRPAADAPVVVEGRGVRVWFPVGERFFARPRQLRAVDGIDFVIRRGETLGVVGESGCGKSTLARAALKLIPANSGSVTLLGRDLTDARRKELRAARKDLQIVFQDPLASLDPRMTIGDAIAEPLDVFRKGLTRGERREAVAKVMEAVSLPPELVNRYPHELSGGQNQRVGIARAVVLDPALVICDEAVSALDVSVRAQILQLLTALQVRLGAAMMFISHDLAVIRQVSHRVMVLYLGGVVEEADAQTLYADPRHPYTRALMSAAPLPDPDLERARVRLRLEGEPPSPLDPVARLRFLPSRREELPAYVPRLLEVSPGHLVQEFDPT